MVISTYVKRESMSGHVAYPAVDFNQARNLKDGPRAEGNRAMTCENSYQISACDEEEEHATEP